MADKTIQQANLRETLDGTEQLPVSYGGNPFRVFVNGIKDYIINNFFTNKSVTDQLGDIGGELSYKNALVRGASPAGATGDIQLNDGAGGLGVADAGVGKYEGNGAWTFGSDSFAIVGGFSFRAGGNNIASGPYSFAAGGDSNEASGNLSTCIGGSSLQAEGDYSIAAGEANQCLGQYSSVMGGKSAKTTLYGERAYSAGMFQFHGDSEERIFIARAITTSNNNTLLKLDNSLLYIVLPTMSFGWAFKVKVVGVKDDGSSAAFFFEGCIQRKSDASVNFAGTPLKTSYMDDGGLTGVDVEVIANNTDKRLDIQVTGRAETNIRWTAVVDVAQSVWGAW